MEGARKNFFFFLFFFFFCGVTRSENEDFQQQIDNGDINDDDDNLSVPEDDFAPPVPADIYEYEESDDNEDGSVALKEPEQADISGEVIEQPVYANTSADILSVLQKDILPVLQKDFAAFHSSSPVMNDLIKIIEDAVSNLLPLMSSDDKDAKTKRELIFYNMAMALEGRRLFTDQTTSDLMKEFRSHFAHTPVKEATEKKLIQLLRLNVARIVKAIAPACLDEESLYKEFAKAMGLMTTEGSEDFPCLRGEIETIHRNFRGRGP